MNYIAARGCGQELGAKLSKYSAVPSAMHLETQPGRGISLVSCNPTNVIYFEDSQLLLNGDLVTFVYLK